MLVTDPPPTDSYDDGDSATVTILEHLADRAAPVRVATRLTAVVRAGLDVVLRPHDARVELLGPNGPPDGLPGADLELFDPATVPPSGSPGTVPRVALTWDTSPAGIVRARALGAVRVLPLSIRAADLVTACEDVRSAARGVESEARDDLLSPREVDVVSGICRGLSNADIAAELHVSVNSVKTYIRTAYRKMGVGSRSQALLWGLDRGL